MPPPRVQTRMKKSNEVVREHVDDVHEKKGSVSFVGERVLITPSFLARIIKAVTRPL